MSTLAFDWQTGAAAVAGQWRKAQELSRRAIDLAGARRYERSRGGLCCRASAEAGCSEFKLQFVSSSTTQAEP